MWQSCDRSYPLAYIAFDMRWAIAIADLCLSHKQIEITKKCPSIETATVATSFKPLCPYPYYVCLHCNLLPGNAFVSYLYAWYKHHIIMNCRTFLKVVDQN